MILNNEIGSSMKLVYQLIEDLKNNVQRVVKTQSLTLNDDKPLMGLKGTHGLFASDEWWESIRQGKIPVQKIEGIVQRAYIAGQDKSAFNDMVDLLLDDGSICSIGIYTNNKADTELFKPGAKAVIAYALDELKSQPAPDGGVNYSRVALEMAVSV